MDSWWGSTLDDARRYGLLMDKVTVSLTRLKNFVSSHFYPSHVGRLLRRHASLPRPLALRGLPVALALGTSLSAVDDRTLIIMWSPEPRFAALELAVRAAENTLKFTSTVVHGTHSSPGDAPTHTVTHSPPGARTHHPRAHL